MLPLKDQNLKIIIAFTLGVIVAVAVVGLLGIATANADFNMRSGAGMASNMMDQMMSSRRNMMSMMNMMSEMNMNDNMTQMMNGCMGMMGKHTHRALADNEQVDSSFSQKLGMPCCGLIPQGKGTDARAQKGAEKHQAKPPREHEPVIQLDTRLIESPHPQHRHRNPQSLQEKSASWEYELSVRE